MAKIVVKLKDKLVTELILHKDSVTTVGRDHSNSIHLVNPAVSRFHAKICSIDEEFYIEDLKSANGTFLNGKMVPLTSELNNNDKISIGKYTLIFTDQIPDHQEVVTDKEEETIFVRKNEVASKSSKDSKPSIPEKQTSLNRLFRDFTDTEKKLFIALLITIGIALLFFIVDFIR
jgi:pSer/pThr/pTyr-binding forkhead associated (FHA) protein